MARSAGLESLAVMADGESNSSRLEAALADDTNLPGESLLREQAKEQVVAAINELPEREHLIVVLSAYEGMTLAAIGDALGITESREPDPELDLRSPRTPPRGLLTNPGAVARPFGLPVGRRR